MLSSLNTDISKKLGSSVTKELGKYLEMFTAISVSIERNIASLRLRIDELDKKVKNEIKLDKTNKIDSLREQIKSKLE